MQITRQADYAVRAILYLARQGPGARASTAHIAQDQNIPLTFLAKIVSQLSASGIVRATRGARGGVSLARAPEDLSLLDIVEAIDGPVTLNDCVLDPTTCAMGATCVVHEVWCVAQSNLVKQLSATRFGDLIKVPAEPVPA